MCGFLHDYLVRTVCRRQRKCWPEGGAHTNVNRAVFPEPLGPTRRNEGSVVEVVEL